MIRYYFFGLIKYIVEHKEIQAILIVTGGMVALVFVPYLVGVISAFFLGTVSCCMETWALGGAVMLIGLIVGAILFNIYREILAQLKKMAR
jgi:ABC-type branched-subunit amino acid transport system permease subunit